jgi:hypothetical protein
MWSSCPSIAFPSMSAEQQLTDEDEKNISIFRRKGDGPHLRVLTETATVARHYTL